MKKILLGLIIAGSFSLNLKAEEDMDPITQTILWTVGSAGAALIGAAGIESYNRLTDDTNTDTFDNTSTGTIDATENGN